MAFFISHADESSLNLDEVFAALSSISSIGNLQRGESVPNVEGQCEFRGGADTLAEVRVLPNLISLEGFDDAILEFAIWFQQAYDQRLVFGDPEAPSEIGLSSIESAEELQAAIEQEWA
ncbi:MAG: hypothetical protein NXI04_21110 [Planctomycetaceae bacterium]|nr:hypothetical protein [Planctomycetaceae bacterium]